MKTVKILIVEDNPEVIESLEILFELRWAEAKIIPATKGEKGIELAKTDSVDMVILDLGLPDMDGFDVLRQIRNFSDVPVIIVTAKHEEIYRAKGMELGADDFITKPFSPDDFLTRVKAVLLRSRIPES